MHIPTIWKTIKECILIGSNILIKSRKYYEKRTSQHIFYVFYKANPTPKQVFKSYYGYTTFYVPLHIVHIESIGLMLFFVKNMNAND